MSVIDKRASGVLMHFTSLPSNYGVGDLGPAAYDFAYWLRDAGQSYWQVLPISPTSPGLNNSPYSGFSAFAGNPMLISPEMLWEDRLVTSKEIESPFTNTDQVDYDAAHQWKWNLFNTAFDRHRDRIINDKKFMSFCRGSDFWLSDYALFEALKEKFEGRPWTLWPDEIKHRSHDALEYWGRELECEILLHKFCQFQFFWQWARLRKHLDILKLSIIGDAPIYVTHDSADVWVHQHLFKLSQDGEPTHVAGVPPDYFSETGQRWGNPVYDWQACQDENFYWWTSRLKHMFGLFDLVRLDHFRGLAAYWEIPASEPTAVNGEWIFASGDDMLDQLSREADRIPLIAEDLGVITPDVVELKAKFDFPGMNIMQFAWGKDIAVNRDAPHNHVRNAVVYSGTHDNNTTKGWFEQECKPEDLERLASYIGYEPAPETVNWDLIRISMASVADTAIFPAQDLLGLDSSARMNTPSVAKDNWQWRALPDQLDASLAKKLGDMVKLYGRTGHDVLVFDDYEDQAQENGE